MQPKNKRKRILRTNASVSGPIKVRNLKTGELAIYTPDRLQPTIPAGWVPLNSNRQQSRTPSRNFRRNSGLVVQTCGNQYRILNSSRKIVAQGKLNADMHDDPKLTRNPDVDSTLDYYRSEVEERDGRSYDWDDPDVDSILDYYRGEIEERDGRNYDWYDDVSDYYDEYDDVSDYYDTRYDRGRGRDRFNSEIESLWKNEGWADSGMSLDDYRNYAETFIEETGWYPLRLVRGRDRDDSEVIAGDYDETWEPLNDEGYPSYHSFPFLTGSDGVYDFYGYSDDEDF